MTAQELINQSMFDLGAVASGETPTAAESADAFVALNMIVSSWCNEELTVPQAGHSAALTLSAGVATYTMGPAGLWNVTPRPMRITGARAYTGSFESGLEILPFREFRRRQTNGQGITAALPSLLCADNGRPTLAVRVWPTPNAASSIDVDYWAPLTQIATLATVLDFAEGWTWALRTALAVALYPQYPRQANLEVLAAAAQNAKAVIVALNLTINGAAQAAATPAE